MTIGLFILPQTKLSSDVIFLFQVQSTSAKIKLVEISSELVFTRHSEQIFDFEA